MTSKTAQKYTEKALQLQAQYADVARQIRADASLSAAGKRDALAIAWTRARDEMAGVKSGRRADLEKDRNRLKQELFGLSSIDKYDPSKIALMRDSINRAARYEDQRTALNAMQAAHRVGDTFLVKAIVSTAFDRDWTDLIDEFGELEPARVKDLVELHFVGKDIDRSERKIIDNQSLHEEMAMTLNAPAELDGLSQTELTALASGNDSE